MKCNEPRRQPQAPPLPLLHPAAAAAAAALLAVAVPAAAADAAVLCSVPSFAASAAPSAVTHPGRRRWLSARG